jgi:osmotically-inducible protein OsmY
MTETQVDSYVIEQVRAALARDPRVNELGITVTLVERKVFLRGTVSTAERQEQITVVVREILPDYDVHNDVRVDEPATPLPPEKLR